MHYPDLVAAVVHHPDGRLLRELLASTVMLVFMGLTSWRMLRGAFARLRALRPRLRAAVRPESS
jgi:hypothetical protein